MKEIIVSWLGFGLTRKRKQMALPGNAVNIRAEFGGWRSSRDIYLWWNENGVDKCKKIVSTKWQMNLNNISLKIDHNEGNREGFSLQNDRTG